MTPSPPGRPDSKARPGARRTRPHVEIRRASKLLKLLSNPYRLEILRSLDDSPKSVSGVFGEFPEEPDQLVKRHLVLLRLGGLVESRVAGGFRICRLTETGRRAIRAIDGYHPE